MTLFVGNSTVNTSIEATTASIGANSTTSALRIAANGNVGINTNSPYDKLVIAGGSIGVTSGGLTATNPSYCGVEVNSNTVKGQIGGNAGGSVDVRAVSNHPLVFYANNTNHMYVVANGNFGIGTSAPAVKLDVNGISRSNNIFVDETISIGNYGSTGTNGTLRLTATGGSSYIQSGLAQSSGSTAPLIFTSIFAINEWMRIANNGNVGIGTSNPNQGKLVVASSSGIHNVQINNTITGNSIYGGSYTQLSMNSENAVGSIIQVGGSGFLYGGPASLNFWNSSNAAVTIGTNGTERVRVTADGYVTKPYQPSARVYVSAASNITIAAAQNVIPFNLASSNIGNCFNTSTYRFTAPVAGRYLVAVGIQCRDLAANWYNLYIRLNGTGLIFGAYNTGYTSTYTYQKFETVGIVNCAVNDYIDISLQAAQAAGYIELSGDSRNYLSIMLLG